MQSGGTVVKCIDTVRNDNGRLSGLLLGLLVRVRTPSA